MKEIDELIQFGDENDRLDFKLIQYKKEMFVELLKDIMAMANSHTKEDRFIIIGLKPKSIEDRGFVGVNINEMNDPATYQQLVSENIEPELSIEYFPYQFNEYYFGIFKISHCDSPPYLMKKDYCKLSKGDGYIRKDSFKTKLSRNDHEIYSQYKNDEKYFNEDVSFLFFTDNDKNELALISYNVNELPSEIEREKIKKILERKKSEPKDFGMAQILKIQANFFQNRNGSSSDYENRDIQTLEKNLISVKKNYLSDDYYYLFEENSNKCNIEITNNGHGYIKDATIVVTINKVNGLIVSDKVYKNSESGIDEIQNNNYPNVKHDINSFIIINHIGNIRHQLAMNAFKVPIRIFATNDIIEKSLLMKIELFGENIKTSIVREIIIPLSKKLN